MESPRNPFAAVVAVMLSMGGQSHAGRWHWLAPGVWGPCDC